MFYAILLSLLLFLPANIFCMCNPMALWYLLLSIPLDKITDSSIKQSQLMYEAFMKDDFELFKKLLDNDATFKYQDPETGKNVLHQIAEQNKSAYLEYIIKAKKLYSVKINTPFLFANERGYVNAERKDKEGKTPFHYAALKGNVAIAELLIEEQVNMHMPDNKGNIPLFYGLKGNHALIINLLKEKTDALEWEKLCTEYENSSGNRAFHFACLGNAVDFIESLLITNKNLLNVANTDGHTPLHIAIQYDNFDLAQFLISKNAPLRAQDKDGNTPLHYAVIQQNKNLVALIITQDSSLEKISNKKDETPFLLAVNQKWKAGKEYFLNQSNTESSYLLDALNANKLDYKLIENLLKNGASTTVTTPKGRTPLALAAKKLDLRAVQLIVQYAPETVNQQDNQKNLPLHLALKSLRTKKNISELSKQNKELIQALLIDQTMVVDKNNKAVRNESGNSVLDEAMNISIEITNSIIKHSNNSICLINDPHPSDNFSPFLNACYFGEMNYVTLFTSGDKADLEQSVSNSFLKGQYDGYTPLLLAAAQGHKDVYNYLKKLGCDQKACGKDGQNLAFILLDKKDKLDKDGQELETLLNKHPELILQKTASNSNLLFKAVHHEDEKLFTYLSKQYPQLIHEQNKYENSAMHKAIEAKNKHAVTILNLYGGMPSTVINRYKWNYLFCALQTGNKEIINICATSELINSIDKKTGLTPLSWAIKNKENDLAKILLEKNADPKIENANGTTCLDIAMSSENKEGFDLILPLFGNDNLLNTVKIALEKKEYFFKKLLEKMSKKEMDIFFDSAKDKDCFLRYAIDNKLNTKIEIALAHGLNPNQCFSDGTLPIHYATIYGNKEIIEIITNKNKYANAASIHALDKDGCNALMLATLKGDEDLISYFLSHSLNFLAKTQNGQTILHFAVQSGNIYTLNKILKLNIDINIQDNNGNSPLLIGAQHGQTKAVQMLVKHQANIELVNNAGQDVIALLKEQEDKASYWDKEKFETTRRYLENAKSDLSKDRTNLNNLYSSVLSLQQENIRLLGDLQRYAPAYGAAYQPMLLSTQLNNLKTLSPDQIKEETKKLEDQKKHEQKQQQQYLLPLWQQMYTQPLSVYQNVVPAESVAPSAPPMTPEEEAAYQASLNQQFNNQQAGFNQQPAESNAYAEYAAAYQQSQYQNPW